MKRLSDDAFVKELRIRKSELDKASQAIADLIVIYEGKGVAVIEAKSYSIPKEPRISYNGQSNGQSIEGMTWKEKTMYAVNALGEATVEDIVNLLKDKLPTTGEDVIKRRVTVSASDLNHDDNELDARRVAGGPRRFIYSIKKKEQSVEEPVPS